MGAVQNLTSRAAQMGIALLPTQATAFDRFTRELLAWNAEFNLTAITDAEQVEVRHYLDSLALIPALAALDGISPAALTARVLRAVDVGAGAGLPGLALRIVWPRLQLTCIEATGKKVRFMEHLAVELGLSDVALVQGRAEELGLRPPHREAYDLVVARAVAALPTLIEYLLPLARRGGRVIAYKGSAAHEEALAAEPGIRLLGGHLQKLIPVEVPGLAETRTLVVIEKISPTPDGFPRGRGLPRRHPLGAALPSGNAESGPDL